MLCGLDGLVDTVGSDCRFPDGKMSPFMGLANKMAVERAGNDALFNFIFARTNLIG